MSGSYTIGEVSGLLTSKKKKNKSELASLFSSASPYSAVFKSSFPAGDSKETNESHKAEKNKKRKGDTSSVVHDSENVSPSKRKKKNIETEISDASPTNKKKIKKENIKTEPSESVEVFKAATSKIPKENKKKLKIQIKTEVDNRFEATPMIVKKKEKRKRKAETSLEISKNVSPVKKKKKKDSTSANGRVVKKEETQGFCPPPGIIHESLIKDGKKKTRLEEREQGLAEIRLSTKKKKKEKKDEGDDEELEASPKRVKKKRVKDPAVDARTIFVGNIPVGHDTKAVRKLFKKYGKIESIRLRSAIPANPSLPKKVAVIKQDFHPDRKSINAYVVFTEEDDAKKALKRNGKLIEGHHIVVDRVIAEKEHNQKKSVFVGNLPFNTEDDELWECFDEIGNIKNVRVIRDKKTGIGKGFAYINFTDTASVNLALKLNGKKFKERSMRVCRCEADNKLQKEIAFYSNQKPKKIKKFSKASNATSGSFRGQKALTDEEVKRLRKKKKMARTGVHRKGRKANVMNAMLRLKKKEGKGDATGGASPKAGKKGLGGKKKKASLASGKTKKGLGSGKKNKGFGLGKKKKSNVKAK